MCLTLRVSPGKGQIFSIIRNKNPGLKEETRVLFQQVTSTQVFLQPLGSFSIIMINYKDLESPSTLRFC